uniref:Uncharacterized protein n=1 Tax=Leersia perrieri TaxID=77586 RepID=A0A0D9XH08_9ORYZ
MVFGKGGAILQILQDKHHSKEQHAGVCFTDHRFLQKNAVFAGKHRVDDLTVAHMRSRLQGLYEKNCSGDAADYRLYIRNIASVTAHMRSRSQVAYEKNCSDDTAGKSLRRWRAYAQQGAGHS